MPRRIRENLSLDEMEEEVLFTQAALEADPNAADFFCHTEGWLGSIDGVRTLERALRQKTTAADARRAVADYGLDQVCTDFVNDLLVAVSKDRKHARFQRFFPLPVSRFMRSALPRQLIVVRDWLHSDDVVFQKHRLAIEKWTQKAHDALVTARSLAAARVESSLARAELAEDLTHDRDALHTRLIERAAKRGFGRSWPHTFFRSGNPRRLAGDSESESLELSARITA